MSSKMFFCSLSLFLRLANWCIRLSIAIGAHGLLCRDYSTLKVLNIRYFAIFVGINRIIILILLSTRIRFLVQFFRNLLLGEEHELRNRTMVVNASEELTYQAVTPQASTSVPRAQAELEVNTPHVDANTPQVDTSTPQVIPQASASTPQVDIFTSQASPQVVFLVKVLAHQQLSVKEMMAGIQLKDRKNFMQLYLVLALQSGYIRYLYPDKPKRPRQRYLLTVKGVMLYEEMKKLA